MKKRILAVVLAAAMLALLATGCSANGTADNSKDGAVAIGGLAPLTGDVSIYGIATNNGVQMAIDEINANGGNYKYVAYDEKGDATEAINAYNKLVSNDKVVALIGDVTSKPCLAVAQQAQKDNMPMILTATKTLDQNANAADAAKRGAFWDLTEYLQDSEAYPNLSQISPDVLKGLTVDGQIIGIPRSRAIGRNGLGYRTDWAEAVGITEAPKTVEDVYDMLYKFTYDDPDGNGANDTYGLEMCKYTGPWDIIQTWFGCGNGWVEQDGKLVPVHQTAEYKEALDWMRKIYADGLVRPDWATVDTANFQVDSQKGVTGVFVDTMDGTKRIWKYFEDNAIADVNDASKIATMTSVGPINGHTLATTGYNGFYLITKSGAKTEEDVKACLHFLDKMCDPEMMALADYGLKDICYDINADGKVVPNGKYDTTNCPNAGLNQAVPYVPYLTEQNPDYQLEKADYQLAYEESIANNVQYAVFNPALGYLTQSDTYAECGNDLVQILDDARTQYICGQIDEAGLQAAFDQWNARVGTQVVEEVNALYAADKA